MWLRSVDDALVNLAQAEAVELIDVYPDDADPDAVDAGEVAPASFDLVAVFPSGWEAILFRGDGHEEAQAASDLLAGLLGAEGPSASFGGGRVRSLADLLEHGRGSGSN